MKKLSHVTVFLIESFRREKSHSAEKGAFSSQNAFVKQKTFMIVKAGTL